MAIEKSGGWLDTAGLVVQWVIGLAGAAAVVLKVWFGRPKRVEGFIPREGLPQPRMEPDTDSTNHSINHSTNPPAAPQILIVDDHPAMLDVLRAVLEPIGYRVVTTGSPREALAILGREEFDVLIADLGMPEMGGLELIRRAAGIDPDMSAIVITGNADAGVESIQAGAMDFIVKPSSGSEIRRAVRGGVLLSREKRR